MNVRYLGTDFLFPHTQSSTASDSPIETDPERWHREGDDCLALTLQNETQVWQQLLTYGNQSQHEQIEGISNVDQSRGEHQSNKHEDTSLPFIGHAVPQTKLVKRLPDHRRRPPPSSRLQPAVCPSGASSGSNLSIYSGASKHNLGFSSNTSPSASERSFDLQGGLRRGNSPSGNDTKGILMTESYSTPPTPSSLKFKMRASLYSLRKRSNRQLTIQESLATAFDELPKHRTISEPATPSSTIDPPSRSRFATYPGSYGPVRPSPLPLGSHRRVIGEDFYEPLPSQSASHQCAHSKAVEEDPKSHWSDTSDEDDDMIDWSKWSLPRRLRAVI